mgnify:CR=1 FL=1
MSSKLGLLIQGPFLSIGRGAKDYNLIPGEIGEIIKYDASKSVSKNIKKYSAIFDEIVISTWQDEKIPYEFHDFIKNYTNVSLKVFKKDKSKTSLPSKLIQGFKVNNNQLLQYDGCYRGALHFEDVEHVIRIRTDQEINLEKLISDCKNNPNKIIVPAIYQSRGYYAMDDFYFAGPIEKFLSFAKISSQESFHPAPQINPLLSMLNNSDKTILEKYWPGSLKFEEELSMLISKNFYPASQKIYFNLVWRGQIASDKWRSDFKYKTYSENYNKKFLFNYFPPNYKNLDDFFFKKDVSFLHKLIRRIITKISMYFRER